MAYSDPEMAYEEPRTASAGLLSPANQAVPMRETLMNRELSILEENTSRLESALQRLAERLLPVLNMKEPVEDGRKEQAEQALPELVERVRRTRYQISSLTAAAIQLETRLEV